MKYYVAEIAATGIAFVCALVNHAGGCWIWRKLMWLDNWATEVMAFERVAHATPTKAETAWTPCNCYANPKLTHSGGYGPAAASWHYCPAHGMVRDQ